VSKKLTRDELKVLLDEARESFRHDDCLTCECFLGYLAQLGIDSGEEVHSLFDDMGIDYRNAHSCMGCDPCPPGDLLAKYLQRRDGRR
jgi:hypothetical protein